jgi:hypothetical protein
MVKGVLESSEPAQHGLASHAPYDRPKVYPGDWSCLACGIEDAINDKSSFCWTCWRNYVGMHVVE